MAIDQEKAKQDLENAERIKELEETRRRTKEILEASSPSPPRPVDFPTRV